MELKSYQQKVLADLSEWLSLVNEKGDFQAAWKSYWEARGVAVGPGGAPAYNNAIAGVSHVCMKVPTGGGKTFMACAALRPVYDALPPGLPRVVVWLVPSRAILEQTFRNLSSPGHPYRERLLRDFSGRLSVLSKEELLIGQNFSPDTVRSSLTVCVLSYDSLRIDSRKKDVRKVYQDNGALYPFAAMEDPALLLPGTPDTALIQVLRQCRPVVVVDESHNAGSDLSIEMLRRLHPSFVLDLTATPRKNSNVISYVDARALKKEHMVKVPVLVYNRERRSEVLADAVRLRYTLEKEARREEMLGAPYIRPMVLFQAQPKNAADSATFDKVKALLVKMGIPEREIAVKTSKKDELAGVDLFSKDCPIRYIITVNALKEGWDCSFAYILASLANKTSKVDVEQILGRVLRQPFARPHPSALLNLSYVLTASADFNDTVRSVVAGLTEAGFSRKDYRLAETAEMAPPLVPSPLPFADGTGGDDFSDIPAVPLALTPEYMDGKEQEAPLSAAVSAMTDQAKAAADHYEKETNEWEKSGLAGGEVAAMQHPFEINEEYRASAEAVKIPQFFIKTGMSLFEQSAGAFLTRADLSEGFTLAGEGARIRFTSRPAELYEVDLKERGEAVPEYRRTSRAQQAYFKNILAERPKEYRERDMVNLLSREINEKNDRLAASDIRDYVRRVLAGMTGAEREDGENDIPGLAACITEEIRRKEAFFQQRSFYGKTEQGSVYAAPSYTLPARIMPARAISAIPKSLYEAEWDDMNGFETRLAGAMAAEASVLWWHRVRERGKGEFFINGFLHHYPDFMVMTKAGRLLLVEAKGEHLDNQDSADKLALGQKWAAMAGLRYRYFMVFEQKETEMNGSYSMSDFLTVLCHL